MLRNAVKGLATRRAGIAGASFLALDVGTEWAKAVIVASRAAEVLGVGRVRQRLGDMDGGAIAHIEGVAERVTRAINEAVTLAGVVPQYCVTGIAGELVQGVVSNVDSVRRHPEAPLSMPEIRRLAATCLHQAKAEACRKVTECTGLENPHVELVDTALVDVAIDGYRVANPVDFRGRHLHITVFHTFSPLVHIRALQTVVHRAGCELLGLVAEPYAVAACALPPEAYELGAIVIDIGGGSTDVAVVEKRGLTGTKMIAMGGRTFTRSLADALGQDMETAEEMKLDYAVGNLEAAAASRVRQVVHDDLQVWRDALRFAYADLKGACVLPTRIYLCGGGSGLPEVLPLLRESAWVRQGYFARPPKVTLLSPQCVSGISDTQGFLQGIRDVTPKALAAQGLRLLAGKQVWTEPAATLEKEV